MLNAIRETRSSKDGLHSIKLELPESEYTFEDFNEDNAKKLLEMYLSYHQDDGRPSDVKIHHNANSHMVSITAHLHYLDNSKTTQRTYPSDVF
ncbi:hypothetical protein BFT35_11295 [Thermoanaerobacterium thermosaccharolyticum]|uniref:Uncharacterized protein n=2 Tax=Thermoanaerobacterium thermosaccharolyticum TaxID=1517 RepID=A0A231VF94_THETR|nr:hypothetical protein [Thermoanaerobacterium thermosaccharolyticum]AGB17782.1 hypothetical protein Thethe_00030 [Thermoanaerobacterium thermosaccharolyticum M0795]AST57467.1 uncharacterized protein Thert_01410 [Thermoanaerobacterium thermosaccharolyticum]OXT06691.1 hypothetical protein CE561_10130 [Thermoanaerobacterium thermosaccharolyticum]PHO06416.1 hypothetical protein BFT35_11295 [Thermoanaerobacterium thermosaccharolyticum]